MSRCCEPPRGPSSRRSRRATSRPGDATTHVSANTGASEVRVMKPWMLYLVLGVVFALLCDWRLQESSRRERIVNALLSVCAWPLFAPLVMLPGLARRAERESDASL